MSDTVWREEVTAAAGQNSEAIPIPGWVTDLAVTALPGGGGSATIQHSMDAPSALANWVDWDPGSVSVDTSRGINGMVTAVRIAAVTQPAVLQVVGRRLRQ